MDRLADEGTTFDAAYCNAPLCVPSRLSFLTGQHVSHCEGWDNATPLPTDAMTWPHMLRSLGYEVVLSGKMHLLGPDVLHGFERQLAYDPHGIGDEDDAAARRLGRSSGGLHGIFPWEEGIPPSAQPWRDVQQAGPGTGPMIEADDAIEAAALEYLRGPARQDRPVRAVRRLHRAALPVHRAGAVLLDVPPGARGSALESRGAPGEPAGGGAAGCGSGSTSRVTATRRSGGRGRRTTG